MPFDIRQLRYALAAADHGSFHRAARVLDVEELHFAALFSLLERAVAAKLFTRSRAGVTTTTAGVEVMPQAREIVSRADRLVEAMRAVGQGRAGGLYMTCTDATGAVIRLNLDPLAKQFQKEGFPISPLVKSTAGPWC